MDKRPKSLFPGDEPPRSVDSVYAIPTSPRLPAKANARRFAANVRPIIEEIMRAGVTSRKAIA